MKLSEAAAAYQIQLEADGRSDHTRRQYARHLALLENWLRSERIEPNIQNLSHHDIARFLASPVAKERADGTPKRATSVNALRSSVRTFFAYCHGAGWTSSNPSRLLRRARTASAPPRALTDAEEERLVAVLDRAEPRDALLFTLLLRAGLRIGSALGLDVDDVDLDEGVLTIHAKGDRIERVFVGPDLRRKIGDFVAGRRGPVFQGRDGRLTTRHAQRRFAQLRDRADLPTSVTCHSLRHTFGQRLLDRTGDIELVRRALGHRSVTSTQVYARCGDAAVKAAVGAA